MSKSKRCRDGWFGFGLKRGLACAAGPLLGAACWGLLLLGITGCESPAPQFSSLDSDAQPQALSPAQQQKAASLEQQAAQTSLNGAASRVAAAPPETLLLREGDLIRISFPGAPSLNPGPLQIQRDGKLNLPLKGEITAAGMTIAELRGKLLELYSPDLQVKEVMVSLDSSAFTIYVTGAVLRSGKIFSDHPINVLEAIMEAGGVDFAKANLKQVKVIRRGDHGPAQYYTLNMKRAFRDGRDVQPFNLKPFDIIYVPERFSWF